MWVFGDCGASKVLASAGYSEVQLAFVGNHQAQHRSGVLDQGFNVPKWMVEMLYESTRQGFMYTPGPDAGNYTWRLRPGHGLQGSRGAHKRTSILLKRIPFPLPSFAEPRTILSPEHMLGYNLYGSEVRKTFHIEYRIFLS
jgi:hypothetical protein